MVSSFNITTFLTGENQLTFKYTPILQGLIALFLALYLSFTYAKMWRQILLVMAVYLTLSVFAFTELSQHFLYSGLNSFSRALLAILSFYCLFKLEESGKSHFRHVVIVSCALVIPLSIAAGYFSSQAYLNQFRGNLSSLTSGVVTDFYNGFRSRDDGEGGSITVIYEVAGDEHELTHVFPDMMNFDDKIIGKQFKVRFLKAYPEEAILDAYFPDDGNLAFQNYFFRDGAGNLIFSIIFLVALYYARLEYLRTAPVKHRVETAEPEGE
ncbi:hypothetical protein CCB80_13405 [Armatimonadetes bacterium Uphvl-Ar1]|nr:hypothetical protein CCB80_13405 [Armatimonadetes bacterium Uphvl-Ar1]